MLEERLFELIDPVLRLAGATLEPGEEFREPPLDVLRYYRRAVSWSGIPIVGRAVSVVAVVRQPVDIELSDAGYSRLLTRLAMAACGRFPPWKGLAIGLTGLVVTPESIGPGRRRRARPGAGWLAKAVPGRPRRLDPGQPRPGSDRLRDENEPRPALHRARAAGRRPERALPPFRPADRNVRYPIAEARGFPALTFPRGEDSESRASYEAALHTALARPLLIELILERLTACPGGCVLTGAPEGVSSADGSILPGTARFAISVSLFQHSGAAVHPHA